ncbi:hypothetical protein D557_0094 [Bordetella holmesii 70147]|nr:hypothetical protein D557_0094 [Bordetella holmesii 70147]
MIAVGGAQQWGVALRITRFERSTLGDEGPYTIGLPLGGGLQQRRL